MDTQLQQNLKEQEQRLIEQIQEVDEALADATDPDEIHELQTLKQDSLNQLNEIRNIQVTKLAVDQQQSLSDDSQFKAGMNKAKVVYQQQEVNSIRQKIEQDLMAYKQNKIESQDYNNRMFQSIKAIQQLGGQLNQQELSFLQQNDYREQFEQHKE